MSFSELVLAVISAQLMGILYVLFRIYFAMTGAGIPPVLQEDEIRIPPGAIVQIPAEATEAIKSASYSAQEVVSQQIVELSDELSRVRITLEKVVESQGTQMKALDYLVTYVRQSQQPR